MDLLWGITRQYYDNLPMPSEITKSNKKVDKRTGEQIKADVLKRLGGE